MSELRRNPNLERSYIVKRVLHKNRSRGLGRTKLDKHDLRIAAALGYSRHEIEWPLWRRGQNVSRGDNDRHRAAGSRRILAKYDEAGRKAMFGPERVSGPHHFLGGI